MLMSGNVGRAATPTGQERAPTATAKVPSNVLREPPTTVARGAQSDSNAERDSYAVTAFSDIVDRSLHAAAVRFTLGLSPAALAEAYLDWATHLHAAACRCIDSVTELHSWSPIRAGVVR